ncbi:MAG: hypothetical protein HY900_15120 [Deltaproteobacteria bacterium]|nr:hypothetical protein [Deltaproteobacteria bacterium]
MKTALLYCRRCNDLYGCADAGRKSCRLCTTHDCPLLPAPIARTGLCPECANTSGRSQARRFLVAAYGALLAFSAADWAPRRLA